MRDGCIIMSVKTEQRCKRYNWNRIVEDFGEGFPNHLKEASDKYYYLLYSVAESAEIQRGARQQSYNPPNAKKRPFTEHANSVLTACKQRANSVLTAC